MRFRGSVAQPASAPAARIPQELALLFGFECLLRGPRIQHGEWTVPLTVQPLLSLLEAEPIDRSGACLIRDSIRSPIDPPDRLRRSSPPDVVEHIQCDFLGGLSVAGDSHAQSEHDSMCPRVECMERVLVAARDGPEQICRALLGCRRLRPAGVEEITSVTSCSCRSWSGRCPVVTPGHHPAIGDHGQEDCACPKGPPYPLGGASVMARGWPGAAPRPRSIRCAGGTWPARYRPRPGRTRSRTRSRRVSPAPRRSCSPRRRPARPTPGLGVGLVASPA